MKEIYEGAIQPAITYAARIWGNDLKTKSIAKLLSAQRTAAMGAAAAYKTTSTEAMLTIANITPIDLKIKEIIEIENGNEKGYIINEDSIKYIDRRMMQENQHPANKQTIEYTDWEEGEKTGTNIYTDGATTKTGRGAAIIIGNRGKTKKGTKMPPNNNIHQAELVAIHEALKHITDTGEEGEKYNIITDSKSALSTIRGMKRPTQLTNEIHKNIQNNTGRGIIIEWYWVKAHSGNQGNEEADEYAKEIANDETEPTYNKITTKQSKKEIRSKTEERWEERWQNETRGRKTAKFIPSIKIRRKLKIRPGKEITQLITSHGNFKTYLTRFKLKEDDDTRCECGEGEDDPIHMITKCEKFQTEREEGTEELRRQGMTWPENEDEIKELSGEQEWWNSLSSFARKIPRLKDENPEGNPETEQNQSGTQE